MCISPNSRKEIFAGKHALSTELIALARLDEDHAFLTNPSALLIYTYLVEYIRHFSDQWFGDKRTMNILDWGTGKGHITFLLQESYQQQAQIVSCDVAQPDIASDDSTFLQPTPIIDNTNIEVIPLDHPYKLPFTDSSFDVVISMGVLEHVPQDANSLQEINRILKPSGLLFCFFLPYQWSWTQQLAHWRGDYYHDRLYTKQQVRHMLTSANYKLLDIWHRQLFPKNTFHYPAYRKFEQIDQWLCAYTPLKYLATNIEFVACKPNISYMPC